MMEPQSKSPPNIAAPPKRAKWRKRIRRAVAVLAVAFGFVLLLVLWPMKPSSMLKPDSSPEILDRNGRTLYAFLNGKEQWCMSRDLTRISPWLIRATLAAEDQRFRMHPGVDPLAVIRALLQDVRHGKIVSGASTLEMQVVKLSGLATNRPAGKLKQAWGAIRLSAHVRKDDVLTAYLNLAPYGLNIIGCEAASRRYFGKPAAELTLGEAALLAGLPKSPSGFAPLIHSNEALARRDYVLRRMREERAISEKERLEATASPLGVSWHEFPSESPHLAMRFRPQIVVGQTLVTTLDEPIQSLAAEAFSRHMEPLRGEIDGGAVMVLDASNAAVLAHVGSPDFTDARHAGQFDATMARRSPGSTLKPFIYGLAIGQGRLFPNEMLLDGSLDLGLYSPKNFDEKYRGLVKAGDALRMSLNIPAVMVLERLGNREAVGFLRRCGISTLGAEPDTYGIGLALGNCEARLDQLVAAYAMLANLGEYRSLKFLEGADVRPSRIMDRGPALSIMNALRQPLPGECDAQAVGTVGTLNPVAWKTGTSTGNRDAWAFVFNRHYVVGVWLGNPDGRRSRKLIGVEAALPLAAKIFRALPARETPAWPAFGDDLKPVEVCSLTGLPATAWCPNVRVELAPIGLPRNRRCGVHWPSSANAHAGESAAIERWPGSSRNWDLAEIATPTFRRNGEGANPATSVSMSDSTTLHDSMLLQILEPAPNACYLLTGERNGDRIHARSSVDRSSRVHWFLDDAYLGEATSERPLYLDLTAGEHKLVCVAADQQTASLHYRVEQASARLPADDGRGRSKSEALIDKN